MIRAPVEDMKEPEVAKVSRDMIMNELRPCCHLFDMSL